MRSLKKLISLAGILFLASCSSTAITHQDFSEATALFEYLEAFLVGHRDRVGIMLHDKNVNFFILRDSSRSKIDVYPIFGFGEETTAQFSVYREFVTARKAKCVISENGAFSCDGDTKSEKLAADKIRTLFAALRAARAVGVFLKLSGEEI